MCVCRDWIKSLSDTAMNSFTRAIALGCQLKEPWIICSAGAYIWNYNVHRLDQGRHRELLVPLHAVLEGLRAIGHAGYFLCI